MMQNKELLEHVDPAWTDLLHNQPERLDEVVVGEDSFPLWVYPLILNFLLQLEIPEAEAREHLARIRNHLEEMERLLQRKIGIRVAVLDYFHNVAEMLVNPRVIEHKLLEALVTRTKEDPKTGCCNAAYFRELVNIELRRAARYSQKCSLVLLDIDDFKHINDRFGHLFGDTVLKEFTRVLKHSLRIEDSVGRFGGDEFALLLPQTGRIGARCLGERVRHALDTTFSKFSINGEYTEITFSGGIATYPMDGDNYDALIRAADRGLYRSKAQGKNQISDELEERDQTDTAYNEKRRFRRFQLVEEKEVALDAVTPLRLKAKVVNISNGGMLLQCAFDLQESLPRQPFVLHFLDDSLEKLGTGFLRGKAVRLTRSQNQFYLAVSFVEELSEEVWDGITRAAGLIPA